MDVAVNRICRSVDINSCRLINSPQIILLCGGGMPPFIKSQAPGAHSARHYFHEYLRQKHPEIEKRVRLAERVNNWFADGVFGDLLELEEYLASLSDLILLFVESPGSIAELGAFATSQYLQPKTLV